MDPASLIGFVLAWIAASWTLSALLGGVVLVTGRAIARIGPRFERRAAMLALVLPAALALAVSATLAVSSIVGPAMGYADHCPAHAHHLHLCLNHGAEWGEKSWALAAVIGLGAFVLVTTLGRLFELAKAAVALRHVRRLARREGDVLVAPSDAPFCFVAGLARPRIYVSSAAWDGLDDEERAGMIEHERAHARSNDVRARFILAAAGLVGAPFIGGALLRRWDRAGELLCDRAAARAVGQPEVVARAIVSLARLNAAAVPPGALSFVRGRPSEVVERVEALLEDAPDGEGAERVLVRTAAVVTTGAVAATIALAGPLHHALETLLGGL